MHKIDTLYSLSIYIIYQTLVFLTRTINSKAINKNKFEFDTYLGNITPRMKHSHRRL